MNQTLLEKGTWDNNVSWELYSGVSSHSDELVTSVFCVAILGENKVVLTRNNRGWEILGGHVEPNETFEEALDRECLEEGGFKPVNPHLFAFRKILSTEPILRDDSRGFYPYPVSYQHYYWSTTEQPLLKPTGDEILDSKEFTLDQVLSEGLSDCLLITAGYYAYSLAAQAE